MLPASAGTRPGLPLTTSHTPVELGAQPALHLMHVQPVEKSAQLVSAHCRAGRVLGQPLGAGQRALHACLALPSRTGPCASPQCRWYRSG